MGKRQNEIKNIQPFNEGKREIAENDNEIDTKRETE